MISSQLILLLSVLRVVRCYVVSTRPASFVGSNNDVSFQHKSVTNILRMDSEFYSLDSKARFNIEKTLLRDVSSVPIDIAEAKHGMPWKTSIDAKAFKGEDLLYMPFWDWHMKFMKENLTNLRVVSCSNEKTDFSYNENGSKKARIVNICLSSDEYRKIRMTYYDAGDNTQVYNAVCYPDPKYNLPVLGIDLLAFNRKKYLAIVDFQPIHQNEEDHATTFEHLMKPVKDSYANLSGRMSSKFYDETQFFSQQMLFSRFDDEKIIQNELFPAFQEYVKMHLDLVRTVEPNTNEVKDVLKRQEAYDTYSAERDPAIGLFTTMFGNEWAQDFVHDFLFSMSERKAITSPVAAAAPAFVGNPGHVVASGGVSKNPSHSQNPFQQQQVSSVGSRFAVPATV